MCTSCHNMHAGRLHFVAGNMNIISFQLEIKQLHLQNITRVQITNDCSKQMHKTLATYTCLCYCLQLYMHATKKIILY